MQYGGVTTDHEQIGTPMNQMRKLRRINVAALLAAAIGILTIFASAPDLFPPIPPGPIILAAAAAIVAFVRRRWTLVIGAVVPLFIIIGGLTSGGLADNLEENAGAIAGTAIQLIALITAIAAGAVATIAGQRRPRSHREVAGRTRVGRND